MRASLLAQHIEVIRSRSAVDREETIRVASAAAALFAAALVLLAGLLWREHARAERRPQAAPVVHVG